MKLWLLRHGEAEAIARTDAQRELTPHGRKEAKQSAKHLPPQGVSKIVASPYVRAQQTAQIVCEVLAHHPVIETVDWLTPDGDLRLALDYLDALAGQPSTLYWQPGRCAHAWSSPRTLANENRQPGRITG